MVSKKIRITGAQLSFPVGAIQQNKQTILDAIEVGEQNQSDIVVFPELALTGYPPEDLLLRESFVGKNFAVLEEISEFSFFTGLVLCPMVLPLTRRQLAGCRHLHHHWLT